MKRKGAFILLVLFAIVQFSAIGSRILKYENILETGKVWKFEVKPIDPYDVLRGRFVKLRFKKDTLKQYMSGVGWKTRQHGYVFLRTAKDGFAYPERWIKDKPTAETGCYIKCSISSLRFSDTKNRYKIYYPFDRFFMNEYKAPEAEKVLQSSFLKDHKVYVTLRVKDGVGIIENLWVDDLPISDYLDSVNQD